MIRTNQLPTPLLLPALCGPSNFVPFLLDNTSPDRELWRARSLYVPPEQDIPAAYRANRPRHYRINLFDRNSNSVVQTFLLAGSPFEDFLNNPSI